MTGEKKKELLKDIVIDMCFNADCFECRFINPHDEVKDNNFCHLRDSGKRVPYESEWDMDTAFQDD